ncbi:MAG TPA: response regulator transcription factor [Polyangiaceae bacterium]|jgi:two-component system KDP operon response regulator KdpE|nr:response regulator transcription factor [Polyangiaceae bacterium]
MNTPSRNVLIVEDEAHMRRFLRTALGHNGYQPVEAATGKRALDLVQSQVIDLVLLDLGLPDIDGIEVASRIREQGEVPIIVISARDLDHAKIAALDSGANDYVTKPFSAGELLARIRVALRTAALVSGQPMATSFSVGALRVDLSLRRVHLHDEEIHLSPTEYNLLCALVLKAGRVVSHGSLLREVWGRDAVGELQYLRVYMRQLRFKIEPEPAQPKYLVTVSGVGYRLNTAS